MSASAPYRQVKFGPLDPVIAHSPDGSSVVRTRQTLGPYPEKLTERLEHWAAVAPDRPYLAQRTAEGPWRTVAYGRTLELVRALGQAMLDFGLTAERGVAVLSGNDIEHALLMLAAQYVGVPYAPISTAYSLISSDYGKLRH
ncbi:AMP-binding protein, partial [bacterium]|nr:AMP-binding protein [bacterium]